MTPEPLDALVERVRKGFDFYDPQTNPLALDALTELAERVKYAEAGLRQAEADYAEQRGHKVELAERVKAAEAEAELKRIETHHANAKRKAAERERDAIHRQAQLNIADAVDARAQRDELVEALERIAENRVPTTYGGGRRAARQLARAALVKVRSEGIPGPCDEHPIKDWGFGGDAASTPK